MTNPELPTDPNLRVFTSHDGVAHIPDMRDWDRGWSRALCGVMGGAADCYRLAQVELPERSECAECEEKFTEVTA